MNGSVPHSRAAPPIQPESSVLTSDASILRVIVLSASAWVGRTTERLLANDRTIVEQRRSLSALNEIERPDVALLDRQLLSSPCGDLRRIRQRWRQAAIIVLHARSTADLIMLIDGGADDATMCGDPTYACRVHALARRQRVLSSGTVRGVGDIRYDHIARTLSCAGTPVGLTAIEHALLGCLVEAAPRIASAKSLRQRAWGGLDGRDREVALRVYIGHLRGKLRLSAGVSIESVRGVGYRLAQRGATADSLTSIAGHSDGL